MTAGSHESHESHEPPVSAAWQNVTCADCGKRYRCTPRQDYYNSTTLADGVCETCLLTAAGIHPDKVYDLRPAEDVAAMEATRP